MVLEHKKIVHILRHIHTFKSSETAPVNVKLKANFMALQNIVLFRLFYTALNGNLTANWDGFKLAHSLSGGTALKTR